MYIAVCMCTGHASTHAVCMSLYVSRPHSMPPPQRTGRSSTLAVCMSPYVCALTPPPLPHSMPFPSVLVTLVHSPPLLSAHDLTCDVVPSCVATFPPISDWAVPGGLDHSSSVADIGRPSPSSSYGCHVCVHTRVCLRVASLPSPHVP